ncbi:11726_t:CDS:2, partial [Scutellospora calospora]
LRAELSNLKAENKAIKWLKSQNESLKSQNETLKNQIDNLATKEQQDAKNRQHLEQKARHAEKLIKENERLRTENSKLTESERKARELAAHELSESMTKKQNSSSPIVNVIPAENVLKNNSNGPISERSIEPSSSKLTTVLEAPPSKRNSKIESSHTNGVAVVPQENIQDQKNLVPEINKNGVTPRPKKNEGNENDGWITVQKRRSVRQRNSM